MLPSAAPSRTSLLQDSCGRPLYPPGPTSPPAVPPPFTLATMVFCFSSASHWRKLNLLEQDSGNCGSQASSPGWVPIKCPDIYCTHSYHSGDTSPSFLYYLHRTASHHLTTPLVYCFHLPQGPLHTLCLLCPEIYQNPFLADQLL